MDTIITNLNEDEIADLIKKSGHSIYYCSSGINEKIGNALLYASEKNEVNIICNVTEDNDYNGVSKFPIIESLIEAKNATVHDSEAQTISFISDIFSFNIIWFPTPKIFKDESNGYNTIHIDKQLTIKLISSFWQLKKDMKDYVKAEAVKEAQMQIDEFEQLKDISIYKLEEFTLPCQNKINNIKEKLRLVPPIEPDLKRQIELINRTLQFIEIKFEGAKIKSTKLTLPKSTLPFKNKEIIKNIESKLRIFDDVKKYPSFERLSEIENGLNELRDNYLYRCKCKDKNLLKLDQKVLILEKINSLTNQLKNTINALIEDLKNGIDKCKQSIRVELYRFYKDNPPELSNQLNFDNNEPLLNAYCDKIINKINFPEPLDLVKNIKITHNEFDIAVEDYDNEDFLEELAKSDFLSPAQYSELFKSETAIKAKSTKN